MKSNPITVVDAVEMANGSAAERTGMTISANLDLQPNGRPDSDTRKVVRKAVAMVFVDIVGSTKIIAEFGDLTFVQLLSAFHQRVEGLLAQHRGKDVKMMGDSLFAFFDDTRDALGFLSALRHSLAQGSLRVAGRPLMLRAVVHYGELLITPVSYGVEYLGPEITLAARLSTAAGPGQTVLSEKAFAALKGDQETLVNVGDREVVFVKGLQEGVGIYRLDLAANQ